VTELSERNPGITSHYLFRGLSPRRSLCSYLLRPFRARKCF